MEEFTCKHESTERPFLYLLVFLSLMNSCDASNKIDKVLDILHKTPSITANNGIQTDAKEPHR